MNEHDVHERLVRDLFRSLLGREADPEAVTFYSQQLARGYGAHDIVAQIEASAEFQARQQSKAAAAAGATGRPAGKARTFDLQVVFITSHGPLKAADEVARLRKQAGPRDLITILDGSDEAASADSMLEPGRVELASFPGNSAYQLHAHLPSVAKDARWIILVEDHNRIPAEWLPAIHAVIDRPHHETDAYVGTTSNLLSTNFGSWGNFLMVFAYHWHPIQEPRIGLPTISNVVFSRDRLPPRDFEFGEFESRFLPEVSAAAPILNEICIDHEQPFGLVGATANQFHNARTAGSRSRMSRLGPVRGLKTGWKHHVMGRVRTMKPVIDSHPRRHELPRFTFLFLYWLTFATAVGFATGLWFGHGRSPWKLE
ncbi:hypothetical protein BH10PSE9_BH10PSE9_03630 [soil metagenome]